MMMMIRWFSTYTFLVMIMIATMTMHVRMVIIYMTMLILLLLIKMIIVFGILSIAKNMINDEEDEQEDMCIVITFL